MPDAEKMVEYEVPTVEDIAVGLSRLPRFLGQTLVPWTVLQHTLAGLELVPDVQPVTRVGVLFHDAEEALTGDVRWGFKTPEQTRLSERIRRRIYQETLGLPYPDAPTQDMIDYVDEALVTAEAHVLCHPSMRSRFGEPEMAAVEAVWDRLDMTPREAIVRFLEYADDLLNDRRVRSLSGRA